MHGISAFQPGNGSRSSSAKTPRRINPNPIAAIHSPCQERVPGARRTKAPAAPSNNPRMRVGSRKNPAVGPTNTASTLVPRLSNISGAKNNSHFRPPNL